MGRKKGVKLKKESEKCVPKPLSLPRPMLDEIKNEMKKDGSENESKYYREMIKLALKIKKERGIKIVTTIPHKGKGKVPKKVTIKKVSPKKNTRPK